ncbi:MAG: hypothetical protein ACTSYA_08610 [Candidatus Kariarchaeaceae archaeon]
MTLYLIMDDGELIETKDIAEALAASNACIYVSQRNKKTYLWVGDEAGPRKRFIGARAAQGLRYESGYPIEHDADPDEIRHSYETEVGAVSSSSIDASTKKKQEPVARKEPETSQEETRTEASTSPTVDDDTLLAISQKLADLKPIPGMVRDYILIEGRLMTLLEVEGGIPDLYPVSGMPDGSFYVEHYCPRILLENDLVKAVELWRREDE